MRKFIFALLAISTQLQAQTGYGATAGASTASDSQWQNWVFTATTLVSATGAVLFLMTDTGSHVH